MDARPDPRPEPNPQPTPAVKTGGAFAARWTLLALAGALASSPPLLAVADLVVQLAGSPPARFEVVLTASGDGQPRTYPDDDGDGTVVIAPQGGAGDYQLELRLDTASDSRGVRIPEKGLVTVTYQTQTGAGERWRLTYGGEGFGNDEIVVTALRREENLQRTPVSITAISAEALTARSMRDLADVAEAAPNIDVSLSSGINGSPSEAAVTIRGVGGLGTGIFEDPGVGIYLDGVYLARAQGNVLDLLDLERVEVLRGPQGTLFGKNTIGGAISLVTRKPDGERTGEVGATLGAFDRRELRARVGGTLGERVFGSLVALAGRRDGYARSLATGRVLDDDDRLVARGALRWLPSDRTVVDLSADFSRQRVDGLDQVLVAIDSSDSFLAFYNQVVASAGFPTYSESSVSRDLFASFSGSPVFHDGDVASASLTLDRRYGAFNLTSITALRDLSFDNSDDRDGAPIVFVGTRDRQRQTQFSEELQLSGAAAGDRLTWLAGGLFFRENADQDGTVSIFENLFEALESAPGAIFAPPGAPGFLCDPGPSLGVPCFGGAGNPFNAIFGTGFADEIEHEVTSVALFGQATWAFSERLSATFGLRATHEEKELTIDRRQLLDGSRLLLANDDSWDALTPKLGLEARVGDNALLYGAIAWGFKSGGFNGITQGRPSLDAFDPENLIAYEVGFKSDWKGNRLRLNGSFFFNDYSDIQFSASIVDGTTIAFVIQNAGEAESKGFELELQARPSRLFSLSGGLGYLDTRYTELRDVVSGSATLEGFFPKSPEWTLQLSPQLDFDLGTRGELRARLDASYRTKVFHDVGNSPTVAQGAFALYNARLAWTLAGEKWEVALFGTNLGDETYIEHGLFVNGFGASLAIPGRPREWGLSARWRL